MTRRAHVHNGFTLIEVIILVAIIALLGLALIVSLTHHRQQAEDARIKSDLNRLKIAFEDYYNDHNCYPPSTWFDGPEDCSSSVFQPYLTTIPCSSKTLLPYPLETDSTGCKWFKIYGSLTTPSSTTTCSSTGSTLGNYGTSSSNVTISVLCSPSPTPSLPPSPVPSPIPNNTYYCSAIGNCTYFDPNIWNCTPSYSDPYCSGSNSCNNVGICIVTEQGLKEGYSIDSLPSSN